MTAAGTPQDRVSTRVAAALTHPAAARGEIVRCSARGERAAAAAVLDEALARWPGNPELLACRLWLADLAGDAPALPGVDPKLWALAVDALLAAGRIATAERSVGHLIAAAPELDYARLMHAALISAPAGESRQADFADDRGLDLQLVRATAADTLLLAFCGSHGALGLPLVVIHRWLAPLGFHILYLRDVRGLFFRGGIASVGGGRDGTADRLRSIAGGLGVTRIVCYGNSGGGYAALDYGLALQAEAVLGMGALTSLAPGFAANRPTVRVYAEALARLPSAMVDLRPAYLAAGRRPAVRLVHGAEQPHDRAHAENLDRVGGVELAPIGGGREHNVTRTLILRGLFTRELDWLRNAGRPAGW